MAERMCIRMMLSAPPKRSSCSGSLTSSDCLRVITSPAMWLLMRIGSSRLPSRVRMTCGVVSSLSSSYRQMTPRSAGRLSKTSSRMRSRVSSSVSQESSASATSLNRRTSRPGSAEASGSAASGEASPPAAAIRSGSRVATSMTSVWCPVRRSASNTTRAAVVRPLRVRRVMSRTPPTSIRSPSRSACCCARTELIRNPFFELRSSIVQPDPLRRMRAWRRETLSSGSTSVQPGARPIRNSASRTSTRCSSPPCS